MPTASSQVTNGGGSFGGGFADDVELANAAYGQGETLATPLQMALVAATVANRGTLMRPHLVSRLSGQDRDTTIDPAVWRQVVLARDRRPDPDGDGQRGRGPSTAGCSRRAPRSPASSTAGKSGTAQLDGSAKPHSWFIGFAPADDPKVAIAVLVESGGSGASRASPIAGKLMARYLDSVGQ